MLSQHKKKKGKGEMMLLIRSSGRNSLRFVMMKKKKGRKISTFTVVRSLMNWREFTV